MDVKDFGGVGCDGGSVVMGTMEGEMAVPKHVDTNSSFAQPGVAVSVLSAKQRFEIYHTNKKNSKGVPKLIVSAKMAFNGTIGTFCDESDENAVSEYLRSINGTSDN